MLKINSQEKLISVGKRKRAVARISLIKGNGNLIVNKVPGNKYFQYNESYLDIIWGPMNKLGLEKNFDIIVNVKGGGLTSQAYSIQLGIARQFQKLDNQHQPILKSFGFLTRDSRIKERKKYGLKKARKAPQYSKR